MTVQDMMIAYGGGLGGAGETTSIRLGYLSGQCYLTGIFDWSMLFDWGANLPMVSIPWVVLSSPKVPLAMTVGQRER